MSDLSRMLDPASIAIAGLSSDAGKHAGRVLGHLRRLGYAGRIYGVNPRLPEVEGVAMHRSVADLPEVPDLVVAAVPAPAAVEVVAASGGAGGVVVFAGGFAESGPDGVALQEALGQSARQAGTRVLGPNSGGLIRPDRGLAASFLTCLDRPAPEMRSGPVAVVTQSGGTGSFLHNLAAARGEGLAVSFATGNEVDIQVGEAIEAVSRLDRVRVVLAIIETLRHGRGFMEAVDSLHAAGKRLVACLLGRGVAGGAMLASHTGALASGPGVREGVLASLGAVTAETPGEAYDVAMVLAHTAPVAGTSTAVVTHSGGAAILVADLAERAGIDLPPPGARLRETVEPLLDHGSAGNPIDMGGIIGGPGRFARVVEEVAVSGEYDVVLAVSTAHPPEHTAERVETLLALDVPAPVIHLWLAGDQGQPGLVTLRANGAAVTDEPRAAVRAVAGLSPPPGPLTVDDAPPLSGPLDTWGLPLVVGRMAMDTDEAAAAAGEIGYPVVLKVEAEGLTHRTEVGGVNVDLRTEEEVRGAFGRIVADVSAAGWRVGGVRVQPFRPGLELIVGGVRDHALGPLVSVGLGGLITEVLGDVAFAPAPVDAGRARRLIDRLAGRRLLEGLGGGPGPDLAALARIISRVSRGLVGNDLREVELNPVIWDGNQWLAVDWFQDG